MKKFLSLVLTLAMAVSLFACGSKEVTRYFVNENGEKVIKIGVFEPQTGENGGGGIQEVFGIRYANLMYNKVNIGGEEFTKGMGTYA